MTSDSRATTILDEQGDRTLVRIDAPMAARLCHEVGHRTYVQGMSASGMRQRGMWGTVLKVEMGVDHGTATIVRDPDPGPEDRLRG